MKTESLRSRRTPYYLYDLDLLDATLNEIKEACREHPNFHVHYAVKANANPMVLKRIQAAGLGIDSVSGGEMSLCLSQGFKASDIVFAGVGKSDWEID